MTFHLWITGLIRKFEKAVTARLSTTVKEIDTTTEPKAITGSNTLQNTVEKEKIKTQIQEEKVNQDGLSVGSEAKEITMEGLWQGLKLKKDIHFGKISESGWKSNKPIVTKVSDSL